ncbi:MAG: glycosyltransferase family 1 protein [Patescibacteria group bacterium]|jgi:glycosyltransferase involved in cell wall biosynthesis
MLIGIDVSRANLTHKSGVEWYAYHLLDQFFKLDKKNQYLLYTPQKLTGALIPRSSNFKEKVLEWPFKKLWTLGRLTWEMVTHKPDVLFVPSHTFPFIGGHKNIITWHDIGYEKYPETYTAWDLQSLKQGAGRMIKMADTIIAVSQFTKNELVEYYGLKPDLIKVVHLGINNQRWRPAPKEAVAELLQTLKIHYPYFVFIGRLALRKNIVGLIRIYNCFREKQKRPFNLVLAGSPEPGQQDIDAEIQASPYRDEIKKIGWLDLEQLPVLMSGARAFLFPSIYEGFGLPALEAMACGVPVIASNAGSLPEIIGNAGVMHNTHDVEAFAKSMIKINEDQVWRDDLIAKGMRRVQDFSWEKCATETLSILNS